MLLNELKSRNSINNSRNYVIDLIQQMFFFVRQYDLIKAFSDGVSNVRLEPCTNKQPYI